MFCVPIQRRRPDNREEITRREEEIGRFCVNSRSPFCSSLRGMTVLLSRGGAGTGKTLIAMEVARRAAERGTPRGFAVLQPVGRRVDATKD